MPEIPTPASLTTPIVRTADLVSRLTSILTTAEREYTKAVAAYRRALLKDLSRLTRLHSKFRNDDAGLMKQRFWPRATRPDNPCPEIREILSMLRAHTSPTIQLTQDQFNRYWRGNFESLSSLRAITRSNSKYKG